MNPIGRSKQAKARKQIVAVVPTVLEQTLFGTAIQYTQNYIQLTTERNEGSYLGALASPYSYRPELRSRLDELVESVRNGNHNHFFVLEGTVCRAAQTSIEGAMRYMTDKTVLVAIH